VEHAYSLPGSYTVTVMVSDGHGGSVTGSVTVEVIADKPGDLNGDLVVNVDDLVLVTSHYGREEGQAGWVPEADANGDGIVSVLDLNAVTANFGKTYP
jgi:hypothetical protein